MQERVLKTLEYDKILDELKLRASCCIGRELAETLSPSADFDEVQRQLTLTGEAETLVYRTGQSPVDDFPDMRQCLKRMLRYSFPPGSFWALRNAFGQRVLRARC